jgi:hypothetical protein
VSDDMPMEVISEAEWLVMKREEQIWAECEEQSGSDDKPA